MKRFIAAWFWCAAAGCAGDAAADCVPGASQASFFMDAHFSGNCVTLDIAAYPNSSAIGLPNDSISSIRVGASAQAFVCRDDNYGGQCQTVTGDIADLSNQPVGNDQISSLKVQPRGSPTSCVPGASQAAFFVDANFSGACVSLGIANYPNSPAIGLPNDSISSIRVGSGVQAFVCRDDNYGSVCQNVTNDVADLSNQPVGNDQISSLKVQPRGSATNCPPGAAQASFFVDANFGGACVALDIANYPNSPAIGLPNDSISSIRVGPSAQAFVCRDDNFGGQCQTVAADISDLTGQPVGNDQISSLKVQPRGTPNGCVPGPLQASFFVDSNFSGPCVAHGVGSYPNAPAIGLPNDSISSIRVGPNTQAFVCRDDYYGGQCQTVTSDIADLTNQPVGNDQISSLKVQPRGSATNCPPGAAQASFFVDAGFGGACVTLNIANYPNWPAIDLPNDSISSIRLGATVQAVVCRDDNYGGLCQTVLSDIPDLSNQPVGNDQISSLKVQKRGAAASCAPGANQASFFVDAGFAGQCVTLGFGDYPNYPLFGLPDNSISSIKVGSNAQTFVCVDENFGGQCQLITSDVADLGPQPIGNDQISSLNVRPRGSLRSCTPGPNQAAFFVDAKFSGACVVLSPGIYPTAAVFNLPNDSISSVRVGSNVQVLACRDDQFAGVCQDLSGDLPDLSNQTIGNDTISSLKVQLRGSAPACVVAWPN